jgi:hypothetical protein
MSDIQRASKARSQSASPATGVFSVAGASSSGRTANPFSGFSTEPKRASWDELSRDPDGETKNYSVPPELIALARANQKERGQVGTLTPLAPKPARDVVVAVPPVPPLALELLLSSSPEPESALSAPSVPIAPDGSSHDPESERTAIQGKGNLELALAASMPSPRGDVDSSESASVRPSGRRSSRRPRRSLRIAMPADTAAAARAAASAPTPPQHTYLAYATGVVIIGGYVALCYYANALLSGLP